MKANTSPDYSFSQQDAFAGTPIDGEGKVPGRGWIPPSGSSIESIQQWEDEYKLVVQSIQKATIGGDELREYAKSEVTRLRQLRHQLFCRD